MTVVIDSIIKLKRPPRRSEAEKTGRRLTTSCNRAGHGKDSRSHHTLLTSVKIEKVKERSRLR